MKTFLKILAVLALVMPTLAQTPPPPGASPAPGSNPVPPESPLIRSMSARTNRTLAKPSRNPITPAAADAGAGAPIAPQPGAAPSASPNAAAPAPANAQPAVAPGVTPPAPAEALEEIFPPGTMQFPAAPVEKVLDLYGQFSGRTMLRDPKLPDLSKLTVTLIQQTPLTRSEVMQVLEAALAMNGIALIKSGDKILKIVPTTTAGGAAGRPDSRSSTNMNELGTFTTHIVQLKYAKPTEMVPLLTPFGTPGMPVAQAIDSTYMLILRDNEENVKRMLELIERIDVNIPAEIVSQVIPIKFAKAEDIASALNSISGGGGSSTFGTRSSGGTGGTGMSGRTGTTGGFGSRNTTPFGAPGQPTTGVPSSTANFSQRINDIVNRASSPGGGSGDFQLIGPNKIIADVRANSLLVFASTNDMTTITNIISKLDIVLAQVMIETIIMDVSLNHDWNLGVSAQQRQKAFDGRSATNSRALGVGGFNNGQSFFDFLGSTASNLPAGSSYFGQVGIGPTFDIALQAAATDSRINVIQKPRIMTSHAKKGSIFLGETRPTVSSTYYGGGFGGSPSSSYQQLEVGIRLDITPYINTDGLVVMEIQQEINEISGVTILTGVGEVPNTTKRSLEAEVAVKNGETIMLGGFIRDSSSGSKSGVPLLKDIPLIGKLFSSSSTKKGRSELVVLMKPTVLRTPEEAAMHTDIEKARMPGVRAAEAELEKEESKKADASKKKTVFRDVSSKSQTQPAAIKAPAAAEVPR